MSAHGVSILEVQPSDTIEQVRERMSKYSARVTELLRRYPVKRAALLQTLWLVQEEYGWVPRIAMKWCAEVCEVSPVHAFSVVEFYTMYKQVPNARFHVRVCHNVSCHIQGAEDLISHLENKLSLKCGEHDADQLFALERVECLAACSNGPAVQINDEFLFGPGKEFNCHEENWHPTAEIMDEWIDRMRKEAAENPTAVNPDELGGIVLETDGHPGAPEASAEVQLKDYAPLPPALGVSAKGEGSAITVAGMVPPEVRNAIFERSDDDGKTWKEIGQVDPAKIPGPPGPKQVSVTDELAIGSSAQYRIGTDCGDRGHGPLSEVMSITAESAPEKEAEGGDA